MKSLVLALAFTATLASAAAAQTFDYTVRGTNLDGSAYQGTARITVLSETTCRIDWETGATTSTGICMRWDDDMAAGYTLEGRAGMIMYRRAGEGWEGRWTVAGQNGVGTERLTPR